MTYVDGFITPVPNEKKHEYVEYSTTMGKIFKSHGALSWVQCWADEVPDPGNTSFIKAVKCEPNESVCFAWITWPSKEARNRAMAAFREEMQERETPQLFDQSRMIVGGFETVVSL
ncbi:MAG: DUF1428 domain-containing protein [Gammaproteobacteria bacterium]|nr:DUF1428 domain-containing protein [Gammaproteobacteria bacterium]